jgi:hypothetical protein
MYGLQFREELDEPVAREFDAMIARFNSFLTTEHNEDGTHNFDLSGARESILSVIDSYQASGQWWKTGPWKLDDPTAELPNVAGAIPPKLTTGTYNDYAPLGIDTAIVLELEPDGGDVTLNGLRALDGVNSKRLLMLRNRDSANSLILAHEATGSIANYRFDNPDSEDIELAPGQNVWLYYDPNRNGGRWTAAITGQTNGPLSPGTVTSGPGGSDVVMSTEVTLTLAQMVAGTAIELIAAVAGSVIVPISGSFHIKGVRGSSDPSINQTFNFRYATLGSDVLSGFSLSLSGMGGGANGSTFYGNGGMTQSSFTAGLASTDRGANEAINIILTNTGTAGNGSATMTIKVLYVLKTAG